MKKFFKNIFIPNKDNIYEPYGLRSKAMATYLIILIVLQLGVNLFATPRTTNKALAATEISSSEIAELTNAQRAAYGLGALSVDGRLNNAAYNKCVDMFTNQYWDHVSPSGTTPWYFISQAGYAWVYAGENLAKGFSSSSEIINAWMNSPSHRANILSSNYRDMGTAVMTGNFQGVRTTLCVQMFGVEQAAPAPAQPSTPTGPSYEVPPEQQPNQPLPAEQQTPPPVPEITKPEQGSVLNNNKPIISGKAAKNTQVLIFDNKNQIGVQNTEPGEVFVFRPTEILKEGEHKVSAEAQKNSIKSNQSNTVSFIIDTVPPVILEDSIKADSFIKNDAENYKIVVGVQNDPSEVITSLDNYSLILNRSMWQNDLFQGTLIPPPQTLSNNPRKLSIIATDKAGNKSSHFLTISKPQNGPQGIIQKASAFVNSLIPHNFQDIVRLLYFILGFWIFVLLIIDGITVYTKGIIRVASHSRAHLVIIFLMLISILFASLGRII
jgi:uncharacterized protein YkwD